MVSAVYVFFFQAEDGIRDVAVTGVQTCALPILSRVKRKVLVTWRRNRRGTWTNLTSRMTAGRGMARRSLFTTGPSASTISALRSITSLRARRTGTMVRGSNEALSARQRKGLPRCKSGRLAQGSSQAATYATQPAKARQDLGLSPSTLGECRAQRLQLLHHRPPRGPPRGGAALHRVLPRPQLRQRRGQRGMDAGRHRPRHAIERDTGALRLTHQPTHQAV